MTRSTISWSKTSRHVFSIVCSALYAGITTTTFLPLITTLFYLMAALSRLHSLRASLNGSSLVWIAWEFQVRQSNITQKEIVSLNLVRCFKTRGAGGRDEVVLVYSVTAYAKASD